MFFDIPSSDDKIHIANRLLHVDQVFDLFFAIMVKRMLDVPQLPSSSVTHARPYLSDQCDFLSTYGRLHLSDIIP